MQGADTEPCGVKADRAIDLCFVSVLTVYLEPSAIVIQLLIKIPHRTSEVISLPPLQHYLFISLMFPSPLAILITLTIYPQLSPQYPAPSQFSQFKYPIPHMLAQSFGVRCYRAQDC